MSPPASFYWHCTAYIELCYNEHAQQTVHVVLHHLELQCPHAVCFGAASGNGRCISVQAVCWATGVALWAFKDITYP